MRELHIHWDGGSNIMTLILESQTFMTSALMSQVLRPCHVGWLIYLA
jgi:hypothetical protein